MRARYLVLICAFPAIARSQTITPSVAAKWLAIGDSAAAATTDAGHASFQPRINTAHDTLVATFAWLGQENRGDDALRLLVDLDTYWTNIREQVSLYERALSTPSAQQQTSIRGRALLAAARDAHRIGDQAKVRAWATEGIAVYRQLGDSAGVGRGYLRLMYAALRDNDYSSLRALADTGEPYCAGRDRPCDAEFFNMLGESWRSRAQYDSALHYYQRTVAIEGTPNLGHLGNMGFAYLGLGQSAAARTQFVAGLRRAWSRGDHLYSAFLLGGVASAAAVANQAADAAQLFGVTDALYENVHARPDPADAVEFDRYRARVRERLGTAVFDSLLAVGKRLSADSVIKAITTNP